MAETSRYGSGSRDAVADLPRGAVDHLLDLRGETCPFTFVKTWLALEKLRQGEVLRVLLDEGEPVDSVTRSMPMSGDEVLAVRRAGAQIWAVIIQKGSDG